MCSPFGLIYKQFKLLKIKLSKPYSIENTLYPPRYSGQFNQGWALYGNGQILHFSVESAAIIFCSTLIFLVSNNDSQQSGL